MESCHQVDRVMFQKLCRGAEHLVPLSASARSHCDFLCTQVCASIICQSPKSTRTDFAISGCSMSAGPANQRNRGSSRPPHCSGGTAQCCLLRCRRGTIRQARHQTDQCGPSRVGPFDGESYAMVHRGSASRPICRCSGGIKDQHWRHKLHSEVMPSHLIRSPGHGSA